ncbi:DNA helicase [Bacillaceae bacterium SIJ1]|uniref:AAA domain-containing protein n=1 Tax=Litoribacterium kuwaitense TaxID=1398745 RepID=UPI0013EDC84A|nr:AAA domain-containing protein [Litoribacterium kuwaitense]NGP45704.1 DNA helicase [Litoribacterium kuwaitense]
MNRQSMTRYFRSSVAAEEKITFENNPFEKITYESLDLGHLDETYYESTIGGKKNQDVVDVILIAKTFKTDFSAQQKVFTNLDDMTGLFYIPARLKKDGKLYAPEEKYPWIPREFLTPFIDDELAVGTVKDYDEFLSVHFQDLKKDYSWKRYLTFAKRLYESVTKEPFSSNKIKNAALEPHVYLVEDTTVRASHHILQLYDHLLREQLPDLPLYDRFMEPNFTALKEKIPHDRLAMERHTAQMGGDYPLSPSQRECTEHFTMMGEGDILAINGPPGTGKTTLLQSLVATTYVDHALAEQDPPLIVASSTNNQAVTNINDSFGKIKKRWSDRCLEERWVTGVDRFAVYFPSSTRIKDAKNKGLLYTNTRKEHFYRDLMNESNRNASKEKMLKMCSAFFSKDVHSVESAKNLLHQELTLLQQGQKTLLQAFEQLEELNSDRLPVNDLLESLAAKKIETETHWKEVGERYNAWKRHFSEMPFYLKWFSFLPSVKQKIMQRNEAFMQPNEAQASMSNDAILMMYSNQLKKLREDIQALDLHMDLVSQHVSACKDVFNTMSAYHDLPLDTLPFTHLEEVNTFLDTTFRYASFWMAVHYYECRWLLSKPIHKNQISTNYPDVMQAFYKHLSLVTPCFVMTFFQLPSLCKVYEDGRNKYLFNHIDLMIVDEAGQVTPEVAACSFSLAKKAVVVGDVHQIEPVWKTSQALDKSLAMGAHGVATNEEVQSLFQRLQDVGLNTSESSVMKIACKSTAYEKFGDRGLFLSEHRRCYDEIIAYCNALVYEGRLEPKRGLGVKDQGYLLDLPHLGHIQVHSTKSEKRAGSRYNTAEATFIGCWVQEKYDQLLAAYPGEAPENVLGIITPFKQQKAELMRHLPSRITQHIKIGTVHTFQGGECRVILMSTVYGSQDGCFFIDAKPSLLNVAISRAKDSFLIFGDLGCLSESENQPSGLLRQMVSPT